MAIIKTSFTLRLNLIDHAKLKKIAEVPIRRELLDNGSFLIITGYIRFSGVIIL